MGNIKIKTMEESLFRYLPEKFIDPFIKRGEILFRSLSYYRDYEDKNIRGDEYEGTKVHRPTDGLKVTVVDTGEIVPLAYTFESTANEDDIFVSCLSTKLGKNLADKFDTNVCVEILKPILFLGLIRNAVNIRPSIKNKKLVSDLVTYYSPSDPPLADWALPEKIALSKLSSFSWQNEYRIAFSINKAFDVYKVNTKLVPIGINRTVRSLSYPEKLFKVGNLSKICTVHYL